jgi:hypothetical protein
MTMAVRHHRRRRHRTLRAHTTTRHRTRVHRDRQRHARHRAYHATHRRRRRCRGLTYHHARHRRREIAANRPKPPPSLLCHQHRRRYGTQRNWNGSKNTRTSSQEAIRIATTAARSQQAPTRAQSSASRRRDDNDDVDTYDRSQPSPLLAYAACP